MTPSTTRGFTLVELLVVVVIVAIIAGAVLLAVRGADQGARAAQELDAVRAQFQAVCESAMLTNQPFGLAIGEASFAILRQASGGAWVSANGDARGAMHYLPSSLRFVLDVDGVAVELNAETPEQPNIQCFGSGEMTPFSLVLRSLEQPDSEGARLEGDLRGQMSVAQL